MLPSSWMYESPAAFASTSTCFSSVMSRRSAQFLWRKSALSSKFTLASSAMR